MKQALQDWFEAARDGSKGISRAELVDAVVMLGLNDDHKQVIQPQSVNVRCRQWARMLEVSLNQLTSSLLAEHPRG